VATRLVGDELDLDLPALTAGLVVVLLLLVVGVAAGNGTDLLEAAQAFPVVDAREAVDVGVVEGGIAVLCGQVSHLDGLSSLKARVVAAVDRLAASAPDGPRRDVLSRAADRSSQGDGCRPRRTGGLASSSVTLSLTRRADFDVSWQGPIGKGLSRLRSALTASGASAP
jgi:hypothetical protein